jgi:hypothetical protein
MAWVSGPFAIVAAVLLVGGVLKVRAPGPARAVLVALGVPAPGAVAAAAGPAEVALGAGALLVGSRALAAAVTAAFALFAVVVGLVLGRRPSGGERGGPADVASCGCFGRLSARPSPVHLAGDAVAAVVAAGAAIAGAPAAFEVLRRSAPADALVFAALVALGTGLAVAVLTVLPETAGAARPAPAAPRAFAVTTAPERSAP